jgi:hypothetical protein
MHFCKAKIAIGDDNRNIFAAGEFSPVSWPEIVVLQAVHGDNAIDEVEPFAWVDQSPRDERYRLNEKYGDKITDEVFGGKQGRPHEMDAPRARLTKGVPWFNPITREHEITSGAPDEQLVPAPEGPMDVAEGDRGPRGRFVARK